MKYFALSAVSLLGLAFCLIGIFLLRHVIRMVFLWRSARGQVLAHLKDNNPSSDSSDTYYVEVAFTAAPGQQVVFMSSMSSSDPPEVGAPVRVCYPPEDPSAADVLSPGSWIAPLVFLTLGGGVCWGVGLAWFSELSGG